MGQFRKVFFTSLMHKVLSLWLGALILGASPVLARPAWTKIHNRKVVNGHIIHWGKGEGYSIGVSSFKAENMAIQSLVNECGIAHKEIKVFQKHSAKTRNGYSSWSRASLAFEDCQDGKKSAHRPKKRSKLESPSMKKNQDLYAKLLAKELEREAQGLSPRPSPQDREHQSLIAEIEKIMENSANFIEKAVSNFDEAVFGPKFEIVE